MTDKEISEESPRSLSVSSLPPPDEESFFHAQVTGTLEQALEARLSQAIDEIAASRARSEATAGEIARLKAETRAILAQIEANLKQHVA
ncbi:MAG TPA: hypothetical protein VF546_02215 [Pyrinomonadaceae bacterium]|jgi:hypothetical protein